MSVVAGVAVGRMQLCMKWHCMTAVVASIAVDRTLAVNISAGKTPGSQLSYGTPVVECIAFVAVLPGV